MRKELSFHNHEEKVFLGILHKCKRTAKTTMNKIRENKVITIFFTNDFNNYLQCLV